MGKEDVKVVSFWASLFGKRVEWALKLKGVDYEYIEEDISNKSNLLLNLNPIHKKVPVLLHHQKPIIESSVILEYIDETRTHSPLLPPLPHPKAQARFWSKFADEKLWPDDKKLEPWFGFNARIVATIRKNPSCPITSELVPPLSCLSLIVFKYLAKTPFSTTHNVPQNRLCNTKATSQQTLLLHSDEKKHRAGVWAFHAVATEKGGQEWSPIGCFVQNGLVVLNAKCSY